MASPALDEKINQLSDLELGILLSLTADQHCIIEADRSALDSVEQELQLVCRNVFGLRCAVLACTEETTVEEFAEGILVDEYGGYFLGRTDTAVSVWLQLVFQPNRKLLVTHFLHLMNAFHTPCHV